MAYRGRLLFTFLASVCRIDRSEQSSGGTIRMDPDFREPVRVDLDGDGIGEERRRELPPVFIPCQVEPQRFEEMELLQAGPALRSKLNLIFHFTDLERLGLVDAEGGAVIAAGDRLAGLYTRSMQPELVVRNPPGLFVTEARPSGFGMGFGASRRNLLFVTFHERSMGVR